jgi:hypothetical protein
MHATIEALMSIATTFGVSMRADGEKIVLEADAPGPPEAVVDVFRDHKPMLMDFLRSRERT